MIPTCSLNPSYRSHYYYSFLFTTIRVLTVAVSKLISVFCSLVSHGLMLLMMICMDLSSERDGTNGGDPSTLR